jgi:hypothetical protein
MGDEPRTKSQSIIEGTLAQTMGGALASVIVIGLASFGHFFQAGFEAAFGTLISATCYIAFKGLRK